MRGMRMIRKVFLISLLIGFLKVGPIFAWDNDYRVDTLISKISQLEDRFRSTDSKVDSLVSKMNQLEDRLRQRDSRIENLEAKVNQLMREKDRTKSMEQPLRGL